MAEKKTLGDVEGTVTPMDWDRIKTLVSALLKQTMDHRELSAMEKESAIVSFVVLQALAAGTKSKAEFIRDFAIMLHANWGELLRLVENANPQKPEGEA